MPELVLLDDDRRQFTALSRACVGVGIRVHRAGSVVEAVSIARRVNASLALVTDHLSNPEGYSVARSMAPIPTVVCSDALTSRSVFQAVASGAYDCIAKPLEVEALVSILDRLTQERVEAEIAEPMIEYRADLGDVIVGRSSDMIEA